MSAHLLEIDTRIWQKLVADLAAAGRGVRESGAFLLGSLNPTRSVSAYLMYSDIAPDLQHIDYVVLKGKHMAKVWDLCEQEGLMVVADVHTHPGLPRQSHSDRANPIVSMQGHIALIVPNFAQGSVVPEKLGVHQFQGSGRWQSWFHHEAASRLKLR